MSRRLPKDQQRYVDAARQAGWKITDASSGVNCWPPDGRSRPLTVHGSPKRNGNCSRNMVQEFKRHGVIV